LLGVRGAGVAAMATAGKRKQISDIIWRIVNNPAE